MSQKSVSECVWFWNFGNFRCFLDQQGSNPRGSLLFPSLPKYLAIRKLHYHEAPCVHLGCIASNTRFFIRNLGLWRIFKFTRTGILLNGTALEKKWYTFVLHISLYVHPYEMKLCDTPNRSAVQHRSDRTIILWDLKKDYKEYYPCNNEGLEQKKTLFSKIAFCFYIFQAYWLFHALPVEPVKRLSISYGLSGTSAIFHRRSRSQHVQCILLHVLCRTYSTHHSHSPMLHLFVLLTSSLLTICRLFLCEEIR